MVNCPFLCRPSVGLQLMVEISKKSDKFQLCRRLKMPTSARRKLLSSCYLYEKDHHISVSFPDISHSKRTQPSHPEARFPRPGSQDMEGLSSPLTCCLSHRLFLQDLRSACFFVTSGHWSARS
ncbi:hypothetical protein MC885_011105 [Smutsia gigantea]|nr:hypothetical protein MC885_011105 [Smutsia gigantea]